MAHTADVTVQLLDSNGDIIVEEEYTTGTVDAGQTWSEKVRVQQDGLVEEYDETTVVVNQQ